MDAKERFIRSVLVTVVLWVAVNLILWVAFNGEGKQDTAVALTSLSVDIAVGFLTVYASTWAASEFAAAGDKSDIRLLGSAGETNMSIDTDFSATFRMSLENVRRKAGHNIHLVMRIPALPELIDCKFNSARTTDIWCSGEKHPETGAFSVRVPFKEDLVVYESPVIVGNLILHWSILLFKSGPFPRRIPISYDVCALDNVSHGQLTLLIEPDAGSWWIEHQPGRLRRRECPAPFQGAPDKAEMHRYTRAGAQCPRTPPLRSADVHTTIPLILLFGSRAGHIMALSNPDKIDRMAQEQR